MQHILMTKYEHIQCYIVVFVSLLTHEIINEMPVYTSNNKSLPKKELEFPHGFSCFHCILISYDYTVITSLLHRLRKRLFPAEAD